MAAGGKYSLEAVKSLVSRFENGDDSALWFSARTRSLDQVVRVFHCSEVEAEKVVLEGLIKLQANDYCGRKMQWGVIADEYGLENYRSHNWYIKFAIAEENEVSTLEEISFHPLEKEMRLIDGRLLQVTYNGRGRHELNRF